MKCMWTYKDEVPVKCCSTMVECSALPSVEAARGLVTLWRGGDGCSGSSPLQNEKRVHLAQIQGAARDVSA